MKNSKPSRKAKSPAAANPAASAKATVPAKTNFAWWPWAAGLAGLILAFLVYDPALNAGFVFDDRFLPFLDPNLSTNVRLWVGNIRPLLMFSFWADYMLAGGANPYLFHATNIIFHFLTSVLVALIAAKILDWAGVAGPIRATLAVFSGALFLLHPLQAESVAYVASRSENLSVLFYYAAFAVFVYRRNDSMTLLRAVAIVALFVAAIATKEHTLTLPALFLLTDFFWGRGGIRKNAILYVLLAVTGAAGAIFVWRVCVRPAPLDSGSRVSRPPIIFSPNAAFSGFTRGCPSCRLARTWTPTSRFRQASSITARSSDFSRWLPRSRPPGFTGSAFRSRPSAYSCSCCWWRRPLPSFPSATFWRSGACTCRFWAWC